MLRKFIVSFFVLILIVSVLFQGVSTSKANSKPLHYVALGDSLTVGFEPQQLFNKEAEVYGFVDRVYEELLLVDEEAAMVNYGVNGLTSSGLKNLLVAMNEEKVVNRSQIQRWLFDERLTKITYDLQSLKSDIQHTDLITITIGGNDFGARTYFDIRHLDDEDLIVFYEEKLTTYQENIQASLDIILNLNPTATVVLTDQYNPFPRVNQEMYTKLQLLTTSFTETLETVVESYQKDGYQIKMAPVAKQFENREVLLTHILRGDIHPNQKGYERMATVILETITPESGTSNRLKEIFKKKLLHLVR